MHFKWCPTRNISFDTLASTREVVVRFGHLSSVSGIPEWDYGIQQLNKSWVSGIPRWNITSSSGLVSSFTQKILWSEQRYASKTKSCKYHPLQTCNKDGITHGKFLASEASVMLGCPKLEFRAPVGAPWQCLLWSKLNIIWAACFPVKPIPYRCIYRYGPRASAARRIIWACFLSRARSKLRLCLANHRAGYFSNLACDWLNIMWAYSVQDTENGPRSPHVLNFCVLHQYISFLYAIPMLTWQRLMKSLLK